MKRLQFGIRLMLLAIAAAAVIVELIARPIRQVESEQQRRASIHHAGGMK
jgi:hypothetical protein